MPRPSRNSGSISAPVIKEGLYDDFERREQIPGPCPVPFDRIRDGLRSLGLCEDMKDGQDAIYFMAGGNLDQMKASPQLEGFRARGIEVLLLCDTVDSFGRRRHRPSRARHSNRSPRAWRISTRSPQRRRRCRIGRSLCRGAPSSTSQGESERRSRRCQGGPPG